MLRFTKHIRGTLCPYTYNAVPICVCNHASIVANTCTCVPSFDHNNNTLQLSRAGLSRSKEDLERLADSVDTYHVNGQVFIHSTIDGIAKPKIVPTGDQARCDNGNGATAAQGSTKHVWEHLAPSLRRFSKYIQGLPLPPLLTGGKTKSVDTFRGRPPTVRKHRLILVRVNLLRRRPLLATRCRYKFDI